jgi:hypothetical protein
MLLYLGDEAFEPRVSEKRGHRSAPAEFTGEPDIQLYHRKLAFGSEILARALSENGEWRLRRTPRSDDRARSLAHVSKKREYFKCGPETIVDFAPKLLKSGA